MVKKSQIESPWSLAKRFVLRTITLASSHSFYTGHCTIFKKMLKMKKKYLFKSERLGFRNWTENDLSEIAKINANLEVMEHFPKPLTEQETAEVIDRLKKSLSEKWIQLLRNRNFRKQGINWIYWFSISRLQNGPHSCC